MSEADPVAAEEGSGPSRSYRAITRHRDGRILHVRDIRASSDAEAIRIVAEGDIAIRTDLWGDGGLVRRFGEGDP